MANYLPPPGVVYSRGEALRWMRDMYWDQTVIDAVMYHDNPSVDHLRDLVYRHGPVRAYLLLCEGLKLSGNRFGTTQQAAIGSRGSIQEGGGGRWGVEAEDEGIGSGIFGDDAGCCEGDAIDDGDEFDDIGG